MKYAIINQKGGINRISDTEPQFVAEGATVIEVSDEQAQLVIAGQEAYPKIHYRWVEGDLMLLKDAIERERILNTPIEDLKDEKKAEIASARYDTEFAGFTEPNTGMFVRTNNRTRSLMALALIEAKADPSYTVENWKTAEGAFITLDATTVIALHNAMHVFIAGCFAKEKALSETVDAATTVEEVRAISW